MQMGFVAPFKARGAGERRSRLARLVATISHRSRRSETQGRTQTYPARWATKVSKVTMPDDLLITSEEFHTRIVVSSAKQPSAG